MSRQPSPLFDRVRAFVVTGLLIGPVLFGLIVVIRTHGVDPHGLPFGSDFLSFWGAARLVLTGSSEQVYNLTALHAAYQPGLVSPKHFLPFHYPPTFLLFIAPFGMVPYFPALGVFLLLSCFLLWRVLKGYVTHARIPLVLIVFLSPGVFMCLIQGQNGILIAALLCAGFCNATKESAPAWRGGLLLGLATLKPHMALIVPFYLLLERNGQAFLGAVLTVLCLCVGSYVLLGSAVWDAFFANVPFAGNILEEGRLGWDRLGSAYAGLRMAGLSSPLAWTGHMLGALMGLLLLARIRGAERRVAGALLATLLLTPFQFSYDLALLTPALAIWGAQHRKGIAVQEYVCMALLWVWPMVTLPFTAHTHVQLLPVLLLISLWMLGQRDKQNQRSGHNPIPGEKAETVLP